MKQRLQRSLVIKPFSHVLKTPIASSLTYNWNVGSMLGIVLILQIVTGLLLVIAYTNDASISFQSVEYIIREIQRGWILRISHLNGASFLLVGLYYHIGRGLLYSSFRLWKVWSTGILLYLIIIGEAFLGYVLLWGQIRVWGAAVITSLVSVVPFVGESLVLWIWGGFIVNSATLKCFFILHYLIPLVVLVIVILHILFLHETGRTSSRGSIDSELKVKLHPFYIYKDSLNILFFGIFYLICFLYPFSLGDCENLKEANLMSSPVHIQPEWYLLFIYAILRAIPNKLGGVVALLIRIVVVWALIFISWNFQRNYLKMNSHILRWFIVVVLLLTWLGRCPVEYPFVTIGQVCTVTYLVIVFILFLIRFIL